MVDTWASTGHMDGPLGVGHDRYAASRGSGGGDDGDCDVIIIRGAVEWLLRRYDVCM